MLQICEMLRRKDLKAHLTEIQDLIEKLKHADPLRKGYYDYYGISLCVLS